jgi:hypothetical protein
MSPDDPADLVLALRVQVLVYLNFTPCMSFTLTRSSYLLLHAYSHASRLTCFPSILCFITLTCWSHGVYSCLHVYSSCFIFSCSRLHARLHSNTLAYMLLKL